MPQPHDSDQEQQQEGHPRCRRVVEFNERHVGRGVMERFVVVVGVVFPDVGVNAELGLTHLGVCLRDGCQ